MKNSSEASDSAAFDLELLLPHAATIDYQSGDVLRQQGQHYSDTLLLLTGAAEVSLESHREEVRTLEIVPGQPVGEISFLSGRPATGTVTASSSGRAIIINDATLDRLETASPDTATALSRYLARYADQRLERDSSYSFSDLPLEDADRIEVKLCRNPELLTKAQALRYDIYCRELGRTSPYADVEKGVIADSLDEFGYTFVALDGEDAIGSIRINCGAEGNLGLYTQLYDLEKSPYYPEDVFICTKFVIREAYRGGPLAMKLIAASTRYGMRRGAHECYIDTIPTLLPFYRVMGFEVCAADFVHRENGLSTPMRVDLTAKIKRLTREPSRERLASLYRKAQAFKEQQKAVRDTPS